MKKRVVEDVEEEEWEGVGYWSNWCYELLCGSRAHFQDIHFLPFLHPSFHTQRKAVSCCHKGLQFEYLRIGWRFPASPATPNGYLFVYDDVDCPFRFTHCGKEREGGEEKRARERDKIPSGEAATRK